MNLKENCYSEHMTNQEKCKLWIYLGMACEQDSEILMALMDQYNPQTPKDNIMVFSELLRLTDNITEEEYYHILQSTKKEG